MSNKQQTALDWYIEQHNILAKLSDNLSNGEIVKRISDIEKQAKEMEKEQSHLYSAFCFKCINEKIPVIKFEDWINL